jgi:hypothetical protein
MAEHPGIAPERQFLPRFLSYSASIVTSSTIGGLIGAIVGSPFFVILNGLSARGSDFPLSMLIQFGIMLGAVVGVHMGCLVGLFRPYLRAK